MINGVTNSVQASVATTGLTGSQSSVEALTSEERSSQTDAVELSTAAQQEMEKEDSGRIRINLVEQVRAEIAAGTYLTDDKLDAVVNRLHAELFNAA